MTITQPITPSAAPSRRVLVVDDVQINRKLAMTFLIKMGWQVFDVDGGVAALEWLASHPPVDLVMLDISMPDLSGEDVCKQIRANPDFDGLVVVAYTAHASPVDVERYLANGFNAALIKPIFLQGLKDTLARFFS